VSFTHRLKLRDIAGTFSTELYFKVFRNKEVFNAVVNMIRKVPFDTTTLTEVMEHFDDVGMFKDLAREDLLRMVEAYANLFIESYEKGDIASATLRLSDGRKLHIIVPGERNTAGKLRNTILLLSNHEIKAMYMEDFAKDKYFRNDEEATDRLLSMSEEEVAKLDEETKITILKFLFTRALLS